MLLCSVWKAVKNSRKPRKKSPAGKGHEEGYSSEVKVCATQKTEFRYPSERPCRGEECAFGEN